MTTAIVGSFIEQWRRFFATADLPIAFYYSNSADGCAPPTGRAHCMIAELGAVRNGRAVAFSADSIHCGGGKTYSGFSTHLRDEFEYFLSCGIPGKLEGERYKKSPELVREHLKSQQPFAAPAKYLVFKRLDQLAASDQPLAVVFFATPDLLAGLFTLANFGAPDPNGVIAPFCSGCSSIIFYPMHEGKSATPRATLGMFDVSARPHLPATMLTFAVPWAKFVTMTVNMPESFLITESWEAVRNRLERAHS
ncbi:MAG: DUF169 domain-containing protein [candidate division Zixibacteria bacterium]|nr:DUF169 domain-containing protein [candidate division Zixibacteria bacterium]